MQDDIELILRPGATIEQCCAIAEAFIQWCDLSRQAQLSRRVHLIIRGGPYLLPEVAAAIWREMIPPDAVEDILVDGKSWTETDVLITPIFSGVEADM